jgi:hypothetical protein
MELLGFGRERVMARDEVAPADVPPFLRHAGYLADRDRVLLDLYYRRGLTRSDIGRVFGQPAGTVSRRLATLTARLQDPLVVALIEAPDRVLSARHRAIGIARFLCNASVSELMRIHGMSRAEIRAVIEYLRGWASKG